MGSLMAAVMGPPKQTAALFAVIVLGSAVGIAATSAQRSVKWTLTPSGLVQWRRGRRPVRHPWHAFTAYALHEDHVAPNRLGARLSHIPGNLRQQFGAVIFLRRRRAWSYPLCVETTPDVSAQVLAATAARLPHDAKATQTPLVWLTAITIVVLCLAATLTVLYLMQG